MSRNSLEARVMELERRCRRLQLASVALMAVVALAGLCAARTPQDAVVRAQRFELVDPAGEVCGSLALHGDSPVLLLLHNASHASASLRAGPGPIGRAEYEEVGSASLVLRSTSGSARMLAGANAIPEQDERQLVLLEGHGPSALLVTGKDNLAQVGEAPRPHPFANLFLRSQPGSAVGTMPNVLLSSTERASSLELGTGQTPRAVLRYQDGEPSLALENAAGTPRFRAP